MITLSPGPPPAKMQQPIHRCGDTATPPRCEGPTTVRLCTAGPAQLDTVPLVPVSTCWSTWCPPSPQIFCRTHGPSQGWHNVAGLFSSMSYARPRAPRKRRRVVTKWPIPLYELFFDYDTVFAIKTRKIIKWMMFKKKKFKSSLRAMIHFMIFLVLMANTVS